MNKKLRIFLCALFSVIAICAFAFAGCTFVTSTSSSSESSSYSDSTSSGNTDSDSTGSDSTGGDSTGDGEVTDHNLDYANADWQWTETATGFTVSATVYCTDTDCSYSVLVTADVTYAVVTEATCVSTGVGRYTATVTVNGQPYAIGYKDVDLAIDSTNHSSVTHVDAVAATATTGGNAEYWYCADCGKYFSNQDMTSTYASVYRTWIAQTGTTLSLTTPDADNTTTIEDGVEYTFKATETETETYVVNISSDGYAQLYSSAASYDASETPLFDQQAGQDYFTVELTANQTLTLYLANSDVAKITIEIYDEDAYASKIPESVVLGDNEIYVNADDAKEMTNPKYTTFTATKAGSYMFIASDDGMASVNGTYVYGTNVAVVSLGVGDSVNIYVYTVTENAATYTLTIQETDIVIPEALVIDGSTYATLDASLDYASNVNYYNFSQSVTTAGRYTFTLSGSDLTNVQILIDDANDDRHTLTASSTTITIECWAGSTFSVMGYVDSGKATFALKTEFVEDSSIVKPADTTGLTEGTAYTYTLPQHATDGISYSKEVTIAAGSSVYFFLNNAGMSESKDVILSLSNSTGIAMYYASATYGDGNLLTATEDYTLFTLTDGSCEYTVLSDSRILIKVTNTSEEAVTLTFSVSQEEQEITYTSIALDTTTDILALDETYNTYPAGYFSYTAESEGIYTLTLAGKITSAGISFSDTDKVVILNGKTVTGSNGVYTLTLKSGTNYIIVYAQSESEILTAFTATLAFVKTTATVSSVVINGETSVEVGSDITLTATVTMSDGSTYTGDITWAVSNTRYATVSNGVVTGVATGTVTITATADGVSSEAWTITITDNTTVATVSSVTISGDSTVEVGSNITLTATVAMSDNSDYTGTVTWTSSDADIATVEGGIVTGVKAGEVTITATADGVDATYVVTVKDNTILSMGYNTISITEVDDYNYSIAITKTFTTDEAGLYVFSISEGSDAYIYVNSSSANVYYSPDYGSGVTSVNYYLAENETISIKFNTYSDKVGEYTFTIAKGEVTTDTLAIGDTTNLSSLTLGSSTTAYAFLTLTTGDLTETKYNIAISNSSSSYKNKITSLEVTVNGGTAETVDGLIYNLTLASNTTYTITIKLIASSSITVSTYYPYTATLNEGEYIPVTTSVNGETNSDNFALTTDNNTIALSSSDASGVTATFEASEDGIYTFAITETGGAKVIVGGCTLQKTSYSSTTLLTAPLTLSKGEKVTVTLAGYNSGEEVEYTLNITRDDVSYQEVTSSSSTLVKYSGAASTNPYTYVAYVQVNAATADNYHLALSGSVLSYYVSSITAISGDNTELTVADNNINFTVTDASAPYYITITFTATNTSFYTNNITVTLNDGEYTPAETSINGETDSANYALIIGKNTIVLSSSDASDGIEISMTLDAGTYTFTVSNYGEAYVYLPGYIGSWDYEINVFYNDVSDSFTLTEQTTVTVKLDIYGDDSSDSFTLTIEKEEEDYTLTLGTAVTITNQENYNYSYITYTIEITSAGTYTLKATPAEDPNSEFADAWDPTFTVGTTSYNHNSIEASTDGYYYIEFTVSESEVDTISITTGVVTGTWTYALVVYSDSTSGGGSSDYTEIKIDESTTISGTDVYMVTATGNGSLTFTLIDIDGDIYISEKPNGTGTEIWDAGSTTSIKVSEGDVLYVFNNTQYVTSSILIVTFTAIVEGYYNVSALDTTYNNSSMTVIADVSDSYITLSSTGIVVDSTGSYSGTLDSNVNLINAVRLYNSYSLTLSVATDSTITIYYAAANAVTVAYGETTLTLAATGSSTTVVAYELPVTAGVEYVFTCSAGTTGGTGAAIYSIVVPTSTDEDVSSAPDPLTTGANTIYVTADDSSDEGISSTFTATAAGTYTFSISSDADAYVKINNGYLMQYGGATSQEVELYEGQTVTVEFWTYSCNAATYVLTITAPSSGDTGSTTVTGTNATINISDVTAATYSAVTTLYEGTDGTSVALTATTDKTVVVESSSKSYTVTDEKGTETTEFSATNRLKLGGTGAQTYRNIEITTVGACTITVYAISASTTTTRALVLYDEDFSAIDSTQSCGGSALEKLTYTIDEAGTFYLASDDSGINIYGIIITYTTDSAAE